MSLRYKGGVISATPPTPTSSAATGVWTLEQQLQAEAAGNWPSPPPEFGAEMRSLRFNSADSAYLGRTPAGAGNRKTWTWSAWVKRAALGTRQCLFAAYQGSSGSDSNYTYLQFDAGNTLTFGGWNTTWRVTTQVFRDPSSWYHIVVALDTTNGTAANRIKIYLNGSEITSFGTSNNPTSSADLGINGAWPHYLGSEVSQFYVNAYMTEVVLVDGQALTPSSFGQTNSTTGVWEPKAITGLTYGTNGFYLKFADNSGTTSTTLGKDSSGNGNNWTPNNFSVTAGVGNDSLVDTPTPYGTDTGAGGEVRGNYATINPLDTNESPTINNGNLNITGGGSAAYYVGRGTFGMSSGKWYWEATINSAVNATYYPSPGIVSSSANVRASGYQLGSDANGIAYMANGQKYTGSSLTSYGASFTQNDVIGFALDMDAGTLTCYKNGSSQGTIASSLTGTWFPSWNVYSSTALIYNFGQRPFAYTAPSGFKALVTQNLSTPTVVQGDDYFNTVLWTGDGTGGRTITGVGFEPDLVWVKARNQALKHQLTDIVRGVGKSLCSNDTAAEVSNDAEGYVSALNSDGFVTSAGSTSNERYNASTYTYVAWNWKANGAGSSNTQGTITSTVSANTTAGISVVTFTGNGTSDASVGHGLGAVPAMMILKSRSQSGENWHSYWSVLGQTKDLQLNTTDGAFTYTSPNIWGATGWSSTLFRLGNQSGVNNNGSTYVSYVFAPVVGFSAFGSYTGNGSSDGPFVYTGFRPAFVIFKDSTTGSREWITQDIKRQTYNAAPNNAYNIAPNLSVIENDPSALGGPSNANNIDWLSNGFKLRYNNGNCNTNGDVYIYMAFAENPFKYALAR